MVIVKILGGFGNQLFQYAAARALAEKYSTYVKLDVSGFEKDTLRNFELSKTNANFQIASRAEILQYKAKNSLERIKARLKPYSQKSFYKQPYFHFDSNFFLLPDNVYIQGYFQSEKYFSSIRDLLKKEFSLSFPVPKKPSDLIEEIRSTDSVSIHIRRGDYQNEEMMKVHGILAPDYYLRAITSVQQKLKAPRFFLFSDDPNVAANEYGLADATIVSGKFSKTHFEDFYLMSLCKNNIIANSSFSWWAAWLNDNQHKTVIAPENWFNNGPKDSYDIVPPAWIKL